MGENCGSCRWHRYDPRNEEWICNNEASECYRAETEYRDSCSDYEEKE